MSYEAISDQEQIEQIKRWLSKYGYAALAGIILGLIIMFGWQYWKDYRTQKSTQASAIYENMLTSLYDNKKDLAKEQGIILKEKYAITPYADMAALLLADFAVTKGDLEQANKELEWLIKHAHNASLREIARIRAARILAARKDYPTALALLAKNDDPTFASLADEVKGDIFWANGQVNEARQAYLHAAKDGQPLRPWLQMKMNRIPSNIAE